MKLKIILIAALLIMTSTPSMAQGRYGTAWETTISISYGNDTSLLTIGGDRTATDWFDNRWETRAMLAGSIQAYFYHPEWGKETPYFWSDIRDLRLPKEWSFYVYSTVSNQLLEMRWDGYSNIPDTVQLYLIDDTASVTIDMKAQSTYTYTNISSSPRIFRVNVSGYIDGGGPGQGDTTPPDTLITSGPSEFVISSANITYAGSDDVTPTDLLQFSYKLDNGAWSAWSIIKSATLSGLSEGAHIFYVKSKDEAGNEDATPAEVKFTVDTLSPVLILYQPNPSELWPANGRMVDVIISGNAKDSGSGIASLSYIVNDEYGQYNLAGNVITGSDGSFAFNISLKADRDSKDKDGRVYLITMDAFDKAGNMTTQGVTVTVPHR